jgi:hypothetical protein
MAVFTHTNGEITLLLFEIKINIQSEFKNILREERRRRRRKTWNKNVNSTLFRYPSVTGDALIGSMGMQFAPPLGVSQSGISDLEAFCGTDPSDAVRCWNIFCRFLKTPRTLLVALIAHSFVIFVSFNTNCSLYGI